MPREFNRAERVADFIRRELAVLLQRELRDPRARGAVINDVQVSRDIAYAKVYVTFLEAADDEQVASSLAALNGAAGFLRSQLARISEMRTTPKLQFYYDRSVRDGAELSKLIDSAVAEDNAAAKQGAAAGESGAASESAPAIDSAKEQR